MIRRLPKMLVVVVLVVACSRGERDTASAAPESLDDTKAMAAVDVLTWHYDLARSGVQPGETILTPRNVAPATFGKVAAFAVDGYVYAQPLYVAHVVVGGVDREVLYVATQHDSVYAFDASGATLAPLWQVSLLAPGETPVASTDTLSTDIVPEIGITGTPVIDRDRGVLYVVAKSAYRDVEAPTSYAQRLHALSLADGSERLGGPTEIRASVLGTADDARVDAIATISFEPLRHNQRSALTLARGKVWIAWASHGDHPPYHGWLMGFDAGDLTRSPVAWMTTPDGMGGGVWMASAGPSVDAEGNIYFSVGNGSFDDDLDDDARTNLSSSAIKLRLDGEELTRVDSFTPHVQDTLNNNDQDFGTMAALLIPDQPGPQPRRLLTASKSGIVYMLDRDDLGGYSPTSDRVIQTLDLHSVFFIANPVFYDDTLYVCPSRAPLAAYTLDPATRLFGPTPTATANMCSDSPNCMKRGSSPTISANADHDAIVWLVDNGEFASGGAAILHAYDAKDVSNELYSSASDPRDAAGPATKFTTPIVTNGRVYFGGKGTVNVYGLRAPAPAAP